MHDRLVKGRTAAATYSTALTVDTPEIERGKI
jgi:hypothetical protein